MKFLFIALICGFNGPAALAGIADKEMEDAAKYVKQSVWYTTDSLPRTSEEKLRGFSNHRLRTWLKDGYVVRQTLPPTVNYSVMPASVQAQLLEWEKYDYAMSMLQNRINVNEIYRKEQIKDWWSEKAKQEANARFDADNAIAKQKLEAIQAEKVKVFGKDADKVAELIKQRSRQLGELWVDSERYFGDHGEKLYDDYLRKKPAVFVAAEEDLEALGKKFLNPKVSIKKVSLKSRLGKAAVIAVPAAVAGAVMMSGSSDAQADELKALPAEDESKPDVGNVEIGELKD